MARTKEFDQEVVLERAMNFFWEHGYEATSMRDLLHAMQIGRQSLYDTFGDKHSLFVASLAHYSEIGKRSLVVPLGAADGGLRAIEQYFAAMGRGMDSDPPRSCLVINSAIELAPHDKEVAAVVQEFIHSLHEGFRAALEVAVAKGEARVDDIDAVAWHFTNSAMGFGPMSRARISSMALKSVAEQLIKTIRV